MEQHLKITGWLQIANGAILIAFALFGASILTIIGAVSGDGQAFAILTAIGGVLAVVFGIMALPSILAGWGLLNYKPWARVLTLVLSFLNLMSVPVGTAIGAYSIWVLLNDETQQILNARGRRVGY